jgi:hypothetical protein
VYYSSTYCRRGNFQQQWRAQLSSKAVAAMPNPTSVKKHNYLPGDTGTDHLEYVNVHPRASHEGPEEE